jgi:hypothetical protein
MPAIGAAIGAIFAAGGLGASLLKLGLGLLLNFAVAKLFAPKGPRPQEVQSEIRQSNAPRTRHYGRVRTGGAVMFWDWKSEGDGRWLYKLLAISTGGIEAVESYWLNETKVSLNGVNVTTDPWDGPVQLRARVGRNDAELEGGTYPSLANAFPDNWVLGTGTDPAHRLTGVATLLGRFRAVGGADISEVYPGGEPKITALIKASRVYDPRLGAKSTATVRWSENIALQIMDLLTSDEFGRLSLDVIDLASFTQAANDCDDPIPLKAGGTKPRYYGGGSYQLNEPLKDVLRRLLDACGGTLFRTGGGKIGLRVGKWRAPNYTITEDKIVSIEGGAGHGEFDQVTTLVPRYVAPETEYQETTADPWEDARQLALLGEAEPKELDVLWVQHHGQARRLAKIKMAKLNPKWRFTVSLRFWGLLLLEEESVYLDFPMRGIYNEPFWIDSFSFDPGAEDGLCSVHLVHADPESFDWNASLEEGDPPSEPDAIGSGEEEIPAPAILSTTVETINGQPVIRAQAATREGYRLVAGFRQVGAADWIMVEVDQGSGVMLTGAISNGQDHEIRMGYSDSALIGADVSYAIVSNIEVAVSSAPPAAPVLVSAFETASTVEITFSPDVGANYWRTRLYRGSSFASSVLVETSYSTAEDVTISAPLVTASDYWLQSENYAQAKSPEMLAITTS